MPIEIKYEAEIEAIVIRAAGEITYDDITNLADNIVNHPGFRININQLFDITGGEFDLSTNEIERVANYYLGMSELLGHNRRFALVGSREVDFGMMRQYEVFFQAGPGVETRGFRSLHEAQKWLLLNKE